MLQACAALTVPMKLSNLHPILLQHPTRDHTVDHSSHTRLWQPQTHGPRHDSHLRQRRIRIHLYLPVSLLVVHEHEALAVIDQPIAAPLHLQALLSSKT